MRLLFFLVLALICAAPASAYIDPGAGSLVIQAALAGFFTAMVFLKARWRWISSLFRREKK